MFRHYQYKNIKGYEIILFGYVIRIEKYYKYAPYELVTNEIKHIYFNGYYIYAVKLWRKRK
jgi:hypothetical protein